jgi:hypothetical protein
MADADRVRRPDPKMPQRPPATRPGQAGADRLVGRAHDTERKPPALGEDAPDDSQERQAEVAVPAGHHGGGGGGGERDLGGDDKER